MVFPGNRCAFVCVKFNYCISSPRSLFSRRIENSGVSWNLWKTKPTAPCVIALFFPPMDFSLFRCLKWFVNDEVKSTTVSSTFYQTSFSCRFCQSLRVIFLRDEVQTYSSLIGNVAKQKVRRNHVI